MQQAKQQLQDQEQLQQVAERMQRAFDAFHSELTRIEKSHAALLTQVRSRLDQQKIADIQNKLQQLS